jgi:hypothetical protein
MTYDKRIVGLLLLNSGVILGSVYGVIAVAVTVIDDAHSLGRMRGVIYMAGLVIVPLTLVFLVAGGTVLLSRTLRHSKRARTKPSD